MHITASTRKCRRCKRLKNLLIENNGVNGNPYMLFFECERSCDLCRKLLYNYFLNLANDVYVKVWISYVEVEAKVLPYFCVSSAFINVTFRVQKDTLAFPHLWWNNFSKISAKTCRWWVSKRSILSECNLFFFWILFLHFFPSSFKEMLKKKL